MSKNSARYYVTQPKGYGRKKRKFYKSVEKKSKAKHRKFLGK